MCYHKIKLGRLAVRGPVRLVQRCVVHNKSDLVKTALVADRVTAWRAMVCRRWNLTDIVLEMRQQDTLLYEYLRPLRSTPLKRSAPYFVQCQARVVVTEPRQSQNQFASGYPKRQKSANPYSQKNVKKQLVRPKKIVYREFLLKIRQQVFFSKMVQQCGEKKCTTRSA